MSTTTVRKRKVREKIKDNTTLAEIMAVQTEYLTKAAKELSERGYCKIISNANKELLPEQLRYPFNYLTGGLQALCSKWNETRRAHVLIVYLTLPKDGAPIGFYCEIPNRAWSKELVTAIYTCSRYGRQVKTKTEWQGGAGLFTLIKCGNVFKVTGQGNDAARSFFNILEMPQHQSLLLGKG